MADGLEEVIRAAFDEWNRTDPNKVSESERAPESVITQAVRDWLQIQPARLRIEKGSQSHQHAGVCLIEADGKLREVDAEIASIVNALNICGVTTIASCSGHGNRPGNIMLADGRELIIARDYNEGRAIDRAFPDIHGEQVPIHEVAERARSCAHWWEKDASVQFLTKAEWLAVADWIGSEPGLAGPASPYPDWVAEDKGDEVCEMVQKQRELKRSDLPMSEMSDFRFANAQFLIDRNSFERSVYQSAAKQRIRWLSVQLADARHALTVSAIAPSKETMGWAETSLANPYKNCAECGRVIDTREKSEGGDGFGAALTQEEWCCSSECWNLMADKLDAPKRQGAIQAPNELLEVMEIVLRKAGEHEDQELHDAGMTLSNWMLEQSPGEPSLERTCRVCGCRELNACVDHRGACWWIAEDLCSHCGEQASE